MISKSILTTKNNLWPKGLIYKAPKTDVYKLIDTNKQKVVGEMVASIEKNCESNIYPSADSANVFRIHSFEIKPNEQNNGWGSYFIRFAKAESYKRGCEGRMYLTAYNPYKPPHIFYKKQGLKTKDKILDKHLDKLKNKKYIDFNFNPSPCIMYIPIENKKDRTLITKVNSFLKKLAIMLEINKNI